MSTTTNSLVARMQEARGPRGHPRHRFSLRSRSSSTTTARTPRAAAGPLDDSSVSALVALDNAVEAVAARVTPAVVNVAVTSRVSSDDQATR